MRTPLHLHAAPGVRHTGDLEGLHRELLPGGRASSEGGPVRGHAAGDGVRARHAGGHRACQDVESPSSRSRCGATCCSSNSASTAGSELGPKMNGKRSCSRSSRTARPGGATLRDRDDGHRSAPPMGRQARKPPRPPSHPPHATRGNRPRPRAPSAARLRAVPGPPHRNKHLCAATRVMPRTPLGSSLAGRRAPTTTADSDPCGLRTVPPSGRPGYGRATGRARCAASSTQSSRHRRREST